VIYYDYREEENFKEVLPLPVTENKFLLIRNIQLERIKKKINSYHKEDFIFCDIIKSFALKSFFIHEKEILKEIFKIFFRKIFI